MRVTDLAILAAAPNDGALAESVSVLRSPEPFIVDLSGSVGADFADSTMAHLVGPAAAALSRLPAPTVLVGGPDVPPPLVEAADICLTAEPRPPRPWVAGDVRVVIDAVARQPAAALSLVVLLRATAAVATWEAIAAESATYALLLGSGPFHEWLSTRGPARPKPHERPPVHVARRGNRLFVTLDRAEARNAVDTATRDALVDALRVAAADPVLTVELRGNGPCFSSGGDLQEFGKVGDPATAHAVRLTRHPGTALDTVAERTTCYLHGACVGAGIEVPAFARTVVADMDATFRLPEVSMGLIPGAGGTVSITHRIGRHRTAWLATTGSSINATVAMDWGLVDRLDRLEQPTPEDGEDATREDGDE